MEALSNFCVSKGKKGGKPHLRWSTLQPLSEIISKRNMTKVDPPAAFLSVRTAFWGAVVGNPARGAGDDQQLCRGPDLLILTNPLTLSPCHRSPRHPITPSQLHMLYYLHGRV
jgi:hypothetical protein